jgi:hypothetical protein
MKLLLDAPRVWSGQTIDQTRVLAQNVHNYWSDRWIVLKFLQEFLEAVFLGIAKNRYEMLKVSCRAKQPTIPEYRIKRSITLGLTVGSSSNFYMRLRRLFSLASTRYRYSMLMASHPAKPPTRLEYRVKRSITLDPAVESFSNFYRSFRRPLSLASQWNRYSTPPTSCRARPQTRLEYWLNKSLTLDLIVGLCSSFYRSFQRLFSLV